MKPQQKLKIGIFGVSGCAGCLLQFPFSPEFQEIANLVDIKSFPLIKEDKYTGDFDYVFIEGTVCFDEDIIILNELRKRAKYIVALGTCAVFGGVPTIKDFQNQEITMKIVYPKYNHLKSTDPEPIDKHIKVDYYIPECPPNKKEIFEFIKDIALNRKIIRYSDPVCFECRRKSNHCLLEDGKLCLGPVTSGGCDAICPSNKVTCYGCRGPCKSANFRAFVNMMKEKGYNEEEIQEKMETFAGLGFKESEEKESTWLEK